MQHVFGHDLVGALAHLAEWRRIRDTVVHVQGQQATNLGRFLMTFDLLFGERLPGTRAVFVIKLMHVERHRIDQVIAELPVAYPGIAQQIELGLLWLQVAQIMDGIKVSQTRVIQQVLLRDPKFGQQPFGNPV